jgi:lipopolysaccharide/colanic/teichoic acid biosynthesis glycosyltransferase
MAISERIKHRIRNSSVLRDVDNELFLPREVFRKIIGRERDRANRTGEVFSMVVFVLPDNRENQGVLKLLTEILSPRVRTIDAVGWIDSQHVGILLPETKNAGACHFAEKICHEILLVQTPPKFEIVTYPSDKFNDPENVTSNTLSEKSENNRKREPFWGGWGFAKSQRNVDYMFCLTKRILKRNFDFLGAVVSLLVFSPLFLAISTLIKVVSPGPVFYKQQRIGYAGQPFTFLKFRTMCSGADTHNHQEYLAQLIKSESNGSGSDLPMAKLDHDPQIITFGNFLRKSCLDELPQLLNVLRGEMSLVGPRPPIPYEVKEYLSWHRARFDAIPGMTGLWQVSGKNKLSFREMVRLDICYARKRSLWLDVKILFRTPLVVFMQLRGSMKSKNSTIEEGV